MQILFFTYFCTAIPFATVFLRFTQTKYNYIRLFGNTHCLRNCYARRYILHELDLIQGKLQNTAGQSGNTGNIPADGVLADDMDEIIEDVDEVVGEDSLNHFGEFEEDSVYVRNDERKCDYEILRDNRNYADVVGTN